MMNYLISAYSVNPYHGSEDGVGWNWVLQYETNYKAGDRIILLTKKYNAEDTRKGFEEFGIKHIELVITDVPLVLNWFREKYSMFHHMYYLLWQHYAWKWVKQSGINFDVIHHVTMGDYRIPGEMSKAKNARTIFGPVGGAQITPDSLKIYEKNIFTAKIRELVNASCSINPFYIKKIREYTDVIASNDETYQQIIQIRGRANTQQMVELGIAEEYKKRKIVTKSDGKLKILFSGRLIEKKGVIFLIEVMNLLKEKVDFELNLCGWGNLSDTISQLIDEYELNDYVNMVGEIRHDKMVSYYYNADVFVMPSLRETGGTVLIEAMAYGLPIVAFDTSFCTQLKRHKCGIFVETNQTIDKIKSDFCGALVELSGNRQLCYELGKNGYRYANEELTWEKKYNLVFEKM